MSHFKRVHCVHADSPTDHRVHNYRERVDCVSFEASNKHTTIVRGFCPQPIPRAPRRDSRTQPAFVQFICDIRNTSRAHYLQTCNMMPALEQRDKSTEGTTADNADSGLILIPHVKERAELCHRVEREPQPPKPTVPRPLSEQVLRVDELYTCTHRHRHKHRHTQPAIGIHAQTWTRTATDIHTYSHRNTQHTHTHKTQTHRERDT